MSVHIQKIGLLKKSYAVTNVIMLRNNNIDTLRFSLAENVSLYVSSLKWSGRKRYRKKVELKFNQQ